MKPVDGKELPGCNRTKSPCDAMSATGISASTSSSVYFRPGSPVQTSSRRKSSTQFVQMPTVKRSGTPHFYIPGETSTGVFPEQRDQLELDSSRKRSSKLWSLIHNVVWELIQTTLKKGNTRKCFYYLLICMIYMPARIIINKRANDACLVAYLSSYRRRTICAEQIAVLSSYRAEVESNLSQTE